MTTPFTPALEVLAGMALLFAPMLLMFLVLTYPIWPRMDAAWWKRAARNVGLGVAGLAVLLFVEYAMFFWTIPVLRFIFRHETKILWGGVVATILGMWGYIAHEDYKLSGHRALVSHLWGAFHTICAALFITAFLYFHQQAMAHVALVWVFASFIGAVQHL